MIKLLKYLNKDNYNTFDTVLYVVLGQLIVTESVSYILIVLVIGLIIVTVIRALINRIR